MSFPTYPAYKDSGVEWLGEMPEHWVLKRFKQMFIERSERSADGSEELMSVSAYYGVKPRLETLDEGDHLTRAESLEGYKICRKNDLVINIMLAWNRGLGFAWSDGIVSPAYSVFSVADGSWPAYLDYLVRSDEMIRYYKSFSAGVIDSRLRLYPESFGRLYAAVPPSKEQVQIARFLDHETARIDALIEEQQRLIELLKEKRQAVISHAVTKGLNPDAPMKDSGVEWLGEVPDHWRSIPIKYMALERGSLFLDGDWIESKDISSDGIRYITTGNVGEGAYKEQGAGYVSEETFIALGCTEVYEGDVLVSRLNNPIGRACIVPNLGCRVVTSVDNVIFRPDSKFHRGFVVFLFSSDQYFKHTGNLARGATMQRISRGLLGNIRVVTPPLEEQAEIACFLDRETACIDALVDEAITVVGLLQERRSALISAAVTGKIDVRGWQPPAHTQAPEPAVAEAV